MPPVAPVAPPSHAFLTNRSASLLSLPYACPSYGLWFYLEWLPTPGIHPATPVASTDSSVPVTVRTPAAEGSRG